MAINNGDFINADGAASSAGEILVAGGASNTPAREYFIEGGDATQVSFTLIAEAGSYSLEGFDLTPTRILPLDSADYQITGNDIEFLYCKYTATLEAGNVALVGGDLGFIKYLRLNAEAGEYSLAGSDMMPKRQLRITLEAGSFALQGQELDLKRNFKLIAEPGTYALTGLDLAFGVSRQIKLDAGSYSLTGVAADLSRVRQMALDAGSYSLQMEEAEVRLESPTLLLLPGTYALTGGALNFQLTSATLLGRYRPSRRRFQPAGYSFTTVKAHSGTSHRRMWASKPSNAILEIEIDNMFDFDAEDLCRLYDKAQGTYAYIGLPDEFYDGASPELTALIAQPAEGLKWCFDEPPTISGVKGEVCNVVMRFRARRSEALRA